MLLCRSRPLCPAGGACASLLCGIKQACLPGCLQWHAWTCHTPSHHIAHGMHVLITAACCRLLQVHHEQVSVGP